MRTRLHWVPSLLLGAACAGTPIQPLPARPAWTSDKALAVSLATHYRHTDCYENTTPERMDRYLLDPIEADLREEGFQVAEGAGPRDALVVNTLEWNKVEAALRHDGATVRTFAVDGKLPCFTSYCSEDAQASNMRCFSRQLVNDLMLDPQALFALRASDTAARLASAGAGANSGLRLQGKLAVSESAKLHQRG